MTSSTIASHNHQPPERDGYTNAICKATNACQPSVNSPPERTQRLPTSSHACALHQTQTSMQRNLLDRLAGSRQCHRERAPTKARPLSSDPTRASVRPHASAHHRTAHVQSDIHTQGAYELQADRNDLSHVELLVRRQKYMKQAVTSTPGRPTAPGVPARARSPAACGRSADTSSLVPPVRSVSACIRAQA